MADYLLIVWDFINWAKRNQIPVGPGRGSGAGSIVLYLIGITDIEPLRFHLFFERFINPERISYPDIDVDICMEKRGEVINYTLKKYGKDNVAQINTLPTSLIDNFCFQSCRGDDLGDVVFPILFQSIVDHLSALLHTDVDVDIGIGDPLRVDEPLKKRWKRSGSISVMPMR